jgi:lantibiotic biosynthesis protein
VEIAARIHAASVEALNRGEFTLTVAPARSAGTLTSRFTTTATGSGLEDVYAAVPPTTEGALAVQMSFPPMYPHAQNVCRVPAYLPHVLSLGEHRTANDPVQAVGVDDLAITATRHRLHLFSLSRRQVVEPQVFHALALQKQPPPLARFLAHLTRAFGATWHEFDWGPHAHRLPWLPRIRHGRSIICPARWRLTANDLPATEGEGWREALDGWRCRWGCPDVVELHDADRTLRMNLTEPAHLAHLRAHLARRGEAGFTEAVASADEYGWLGGHAHEIAIPLARSGLPAPPPLIGAVPTVTNREPGHLPAAPGSAWLYAKLYTHPERLGEIIATHLPRLVSTLDGEPMWWFVRYRSPTETDHLRLRIHTPGDARQAASLAAVGRWAEQLRAEGLIGRMVFDTYQPEIGRYGCGEAMHAAEAVFAADSHTVAIGLRLLPATTIHPAALVAIGMVDIAEALLGSRVDAVSWLLGHRAPAATPVDRGVAEQVTRWAITGALPGAMPRSPALAQACRARAAALAAYRRALPDDADTGMVLVSLLHMHHNRAAGIDPDGEAACRRLARQAALAWRAHHPAEAP